MPYRDDEEDPWGSFADASPSAPASTADAWDTFSDAPRKGGKRVPAPRKAPPRLPDDALVTSPVDGDTFHLNTGDNLRLWGIDAPELKQQGLDRQGNPVPVGQQSLDAVRGIQERHNLVPGGVVDQSYNRVVGPVSADGSDLGEQLARDGRGLVAPEYLASDPQRRQEYLRAEWLARQNGLGIHNTQMQPPAEFRRDPVPVPMLSQKTTVPQFWDTPTPLSGMKQEDEAAYSVLLQTTKNPDELVSFVKARGMELRPADAAKWIKDRDEWAAKGHGSLPAYADYRRAPKILDNQGDGKLGAAVRGFGNGVLPNFLEETGAVVDTLGITPGRENVWNSDRRLADVYSNNLTQNEAIIGYDRAAHPYVTGGAEIAGGLVVPVGRVRSAADLAKFGGAFGTVAGLGQDGTLPERAISGVVGGGEGTILGVAGGKAIEAVSPYVQRVLGPRRGKVATEGAVEGVESGLDISPPRKRDIIDVSAPATPTRVPDRIDIGPSGPQSIPAPGQRVSTGYPGPVRGSAQPRDRNWIDIGQVPPPRRPDRIDVGQSVPRIGPDGREYSVQPQAQGYDDLVRQGVSPAEAARRLAVSDPRNRSMAMANDNGPAITSEMPRQRDYLFPVEPPRPVSQPMSAAQMQARAADVQPRDVVPIPSNQVGSAEELAAAQAARFAPAKPVNEASVLESRTVTANNGRELPKRGPLDLVTWLRTQGGIKDQGGNLRAMGIDNRPRDLDFARGEQRLGRLIDEDGGMNLDDAAYRAWEAGYLPGSDRPDVNAFLDAIDRTHTGSERFFHPNDLDEVARFEGTRADRLQLEEQLAQGPVHVDRSVPAAEPQPFPPISAYEEWGPNGGPNLVGNIRVDKLDTPQDIARALDFTHRQLGGFDAATRGRVSHAETERLASELGMTPDQLTSRRRGQPFNAEEALAARQIMAKSGNELVNMAKRVQSMEVPGDDVLAEFRQAWMRHAAIQEQVTGMTAEAGRALSQFRMMANSRNVPGSVLSSIVNDGGGRKSLQEVAGALLEAAEESPGKFNVLTEQLANPRFKDKVIELIFASKLSSPGTHVVNVVSNTLTSIGQIPEHVGAAALGGVRQAFSKEPVDRVLGSEIGTRAFGLLQGFKEGLPLMVRAFRTGETRDPLTRLETNHGGHQGAISGRKGEVIRTPLRALMAEDELFKAVASRMELNGLAVRQAHAEGLKGEAATKRIVDLVSNPTDDMLERSMDYARYLTFQKPLGDTVVGAVQRAKQNSIGGTLLFPFIRTPMNLLKYAGERSPLAPMLRDWRQDFTAGGARRDLAVAKAMIGTAFGTAIYQAALEDKITGSRPLDPKKAQFMAADGWQPYSIKVGDQYHSYARLDPLATTMGVATDLATKGEGLSPRQMDDAAMLLTASIIQNLTDKVWLSTASDALAAINDPQRFGPGFLRNLVAGTVVPAAVSQTARTIDPTTRDARSVPDAIQSRIPGASKALPPKRDIWGEPIEREGGVGPDIMSPIWTSTAKNDPVNAEMLRIGARFDAPDRYITRNKQRVDLTPEQYDRYAELSGKGTRERVEALMASPAWKTMLPEAKAKEVSDAAKAAKADARAALFGEQPGPAAAPRKAAADDEWSAFPNAGRKRVPAPRANPPRLPSSAPSNDLWSSFKDPEQRDVMGSLLKIPGITMDSFTSGYRTAEYQADMRRRGYKPAANSGHLDGSSLDIPVPRGRSMPWLVAQVKRAEPTARLLPEGDHLHATFPGWYGAPVLGGAKRAGLRNPNAKLPAPRLQNR